MNKSGSIEQRLGEMAIRFLQHPFQGDRRIDNERATQAASLSPSASPFLPRVIAQELGCCRARPAVRQRIRPGARLRAAG
jgi:hypothetical protein